VRQIRQILVVDDDPDDQEIFSIGLRGIDPHIPYTFANDGAEAIEKLQNDSSFKPDFIFLDINMPRMNGVECLREIKDLKLAPESKIIINSTSLEPKMIAMCAALGADDFMIKPPTIKELRQMLIKVFNDQVLLTSKEGSQS
jgi:CheY-like chemotaxis protein